MLSRQLHSRVLRTSRTTVRRQPVSFSIPTRRSHRILVNPTGPIQLRSKSGITSGLSSLSFWAKDVVRTKSFNPPNPVLQSIPKNYDNVVVADGGSNDGNDTGDDSNKFLDPAFHSMLPYHLEKATKKVTQQYKINLAEWELSLAGLPTSGGGELDKVTKNEKLSKIEILDKIETPVVQLLQVGKLFTELASPPDQFKYWQSAYANLQETVHQLPWRESKIIYQALQEESSSFPKYVKLDYELRGAHLEDEEAREELLGIQDQLEQVQERFTNADDYSTATKAERLRMVSDLYNWIGLTNLQAQKLGYQNIYTMYKEGFDHMATPEDVKKVCKEMTEILKINLPQTEVTLNEAVGAFLGSSEKPTSDDEKELLKARFYFKKTMFLHGVLQGISDFCETIFGLRIEHDKELKGWNQKVIPLHVFNADTGSRIGTIFLDAYKDAYWRSGKAENLVMSSLFTERRSQATDPMAVIALKVSPTWDDNPTPLSWDDTRDLLYQFGNALQMVLTQAKTDHGAVPPADSNTLLANFMEMWILNEGFLHRLVQLSQDQTILEQETIEVLYKDLKKQKAIDLMQSVFLGSLELAVFTEFDPRGGETLAEIQARYAEELSSHDLPEKGDLTPLVSIVQENAIHGGKVRAYEPVWSNILAAMLYQKFNSADLSNRNEVEKLGRGIRNLFYRERCSTKDDVEKLCGKDVTPKDLQQVYGF